MFKNYNISFQGMNNLSNYKACIKGGAIGDALGYPVEFYSLNSIKQEFGNKGVDEFVLNSKGKAEISDDTQMTMFTADGLIKSIRKNLNLNKMPDMNTIFNSYKLWLDTQTEKYNSNKGWIAKISNLYETREPGNTCLSAIRNNIPGSISKPINNSAGCGGVMRAAPVGLLYKNNPELAFKVGAECSALTHSNPRGYLSGGALSEIVAYIITGKNVDEAISETLKTLKTYKEHECVSELLIKAQQLAKSDILPEKAINQLGKGWVGDEALAIACYCALKEPNDFARAVKLAVNHDGDSDSTGAILGNILGAHLGLEKIPKNWLKNVELSDELDQLAEDLFNAPDKIKDADKRYPV